MRIIRHNPEVAPPVARYSQVVRVEPGDAALLFVSGLVGVDSDGVLVGEDVAAQADQINANLAEVLASQGAGFEHVVKVTRYIKDGVDVAQVRGRSPFPDHALPAATAVFVSGLVDPGYLLEVEAVAAVPATQS